MVNRFVPCRQEAFGVRRRMSGGQIMRANRNIEQTEIYFENEGNSGAEPVAEPNKLKMMIWTNT